MLGNFSLISELICIHYSACPRLYVSILKHLLLKLLQKCICIGSSAAMTREVSRIFSQDFFFLQVYKPAKGSFLPVSVIFMAADAIVMCLHSSRKTIYVQFQKMLN